MITTVPAIKPYNDIRSAFKEIIRTAFVFSEVICMTPSEIEHMETDVDNNHVYATGMGRSDYKVQHVQHLHPTQLNCQLYCQTKYDESQIH
jgi:hypothetical protein